MAMLVATVLYSNLNRLAAEEPDVGPELAEGTKAFAFKLHRDENLPEGAVVGCAVDIVGEISKPVRTGIAILNVKLLAVGSVPLGYKGPRSLVVQLTPAQIDVLMLMQKHGTKLKIRLHQKERSKQ
jgi:hypothetical protein